MNGELPAWLWEVDWGLGFKNKKKQAERLTPPHFMHYVLSTVVLEYNRLHAGYIATNTLRFLTLTGQYCILFVLRQ